MKKDQSAAPDSLVIEYHLRLAGGDRTFLNIGGITEIPAMLLPDAQSDTGRTFHEVFKALLERPATIAVNRMSDECMSERLTRARPTPPPEQPDSDPETEVSKAADSSPEAEEQIHLNL